VNEPRAVCMRCRRPEAVCYCRFVTPLATKTRVVILQHRRERDVPINTARIASLCLPEAELLVGVDFGDSAALARALGDPERPAVLLYPGRGAIDVERQPPAGPVTLVVVDGTWWQARKLVRANPAIAALPRYAFRPPAPSDYRIRREPQEDYVSTIEALVHVLGVLEGDRESAATMLVPFRAMVEAQLAYAAGQNSRHRPSGARSPRPRDPRARLPRLVRERARDLVCIYAEANAWPWDEKDSHPDELVQWVACRVATGETFERLVAPRDALAPATGSHLEIDPSALRAGTSVEALLADFASFLHPEDVPCAWGWYTPKLFARIGGQLPEPRVDLRQAARQFVNERVGDLDAFFPRLALEPPEAPLGQGRAGRRLAQMVAIARALG
jgi:DTW domain-containing protein YfiP